MWFWWALGSAIISSLSVVYNKRILNKEVSPSVVSFILFAVVTAISVPLLVMNGTYSTNTNFWIAVFVSAFVFSISKTIQLNIFQKNNLSDVYPLNALQPVTIYILSVLFLGDFLKLSAVTGILLIAVGIYILNYNYHDKNPLHPFIVFAKSKISQIYLVAILLSNISTISEKVAIANTYPQSIYPMGFWENLMLTIFTGIYVVKTNRNWIKEIKDNWKSLILGGIIFAVLYFTVMTGIKSGPVALVSGVKKLEVLLVVFWGYLFFGERPAKKVYIATLIMFIAIMLIKL